MNKRVLYTGSFRFPEGDAAASRVLNNAKILKDLSYNVIFISFGGEARTSDMCRDGSFSYQGFKYINTNDIDKKKINVLARIYYHFFGGSKSLQLIKKMIKNVDIVIGYNPSMYFTSRMMALCKKHKIPFISDITEWYDSNEFPGGRFALPAWINHLNMCLMQKKVKNKIVISSFLDKYYNTTNNIIIPPLVDSTEDKWINFKPVLAPFKGIRLVYAGTPGKKDLLEIMIDAVSSSLNQGNSLQFIIVGVSQEDIRGYRNYKEILSLSEHIILCGKIPQIEVPSYYNVSDFSIIIRNPTRKNMAGFPTKLAETMMSGCPVLLNNTSDISEYVRDGYNGFIMRDVSANEFQRILSKVVTLSRSEIDIMKSNAAKCALEKFDYNNYIAKTLLYMSRIK